MDHQFVQHIQNDPTKSRKIGEKKSPQKLLTAVKKKNKITFFQYFIRLFVI